MRRMLSLSLAIAAVVTTLSAAPVGAGVAADCEPWEVRTVAEGLGSLENLEPDGRGGMLISASSRSAVERLLPDGTTTTVAADMPSPGGLRVRGKFLYANTGAGAANGVLGQPDGTIERINLRTGKRRTYADGLTMPNGLVFDQDGNAYTSRDLGHNAGITRVRAEDPRNPDINWAKLPDTNGLAVDPTNTWLYAVETFTPDSAVYRIRLDDPTVIETVAKLSTVLGDPANGLDDMTIDAAGVLYITANGMGRVWRVDPATGASCIIASGLQNPSAVKFGAGEGWDSNHLYVSGFDGRIRELVPPALALTGSQ